MGVGMALNKEQMREYMRRKRAGEKLHGEQYDDRTGRLDASEAPVTVDSSVSLPMTKTDRKFEESKPGYWIYGKELRARECWMCGEAFETRLELNKFCSPDCKDKWLNDAFGKMRVSA